MSPVNMPMISPEDAFKPYRELVEQVDQAVPMMLWAARGTINPVSLVNEVEDDLTMGQMIAQATPNLIKQLGQPAWLIVSYEGWYKDVATVQEAQAVRHGDLAAERAAGSPAITEAVLLLGVATSSEWGATVKFRRTPHRVRWEAMEMTRDAGSGDTAEAMRIAVR